MSLSSIFQTEKLKTMAFPIEEMVDLLQGSFHPSNSRAGGPALLRCIAMKNLIFSYRRK